MKPDKKIYFVYLIRALRLPFITASILPFIFGSFINISCFRLMPFIIGLIIVTATHLGSNLINDYADSKSGADWQDKKWYVFFGGSKLIQEGVISQSWYLKGAIICFSIALAAVIMLSFIINNFITIGYYLLILFFGFSYSHKPLQLSYHRLGELIIFILFGPATVMGAYFIQTGIFPDIKSFILSLPFGFLTTAILYSNEVPDCPEDIKAKKFTWVSILKEEYSFIIYVILISLGFAFILTAVLLGLINYLVLISLLGIIPAIKATKIIKEFYKDKTKLVESSKLTINLQALIGIILVVSILL